MRVAEALRNHPHHLCSETGLLFDEFRDHGFGKLPRAPRGHGLRSRGVEFFGVWRPHSEHLTRAESLQRRDLPLGIGLEEPHAARLDGPEMVGRLSFREQSATWVELALMDDTLHPFEGCVWKAAEELCLRQVEVTLWLRQLFSV